MSKADNRSMYGVTLEPIEVAADNIEMWIQEQTQSHDDPEDMNEDEMRFATRRLRQLHLLMTLDMKIPKCACDDQAPKKPKPRDPHIASKLQASVIAMMSAGRYKTPYELKMLRKLKQSIVITRALENERKQK